MPSWSHHLRQRNQRPEAVHEPRVQLVFFLRELVLPRRSGAEGAAGTRPGPGLHWPHWEAHREVRGGWVSVREAILGVHGEAWECWGAGWNGRGGQVELSQHKQQHTVELMSVWIVLLVPLILQKRCKLSIIFAYHRLLLNIVIVEQVCVDLTMRNYWIKS